MTIQCIKEYNGGFVRIKKGEKLFVLELSNESYCVELDSGWQGWFPKKYFIEIE